MEQKEKICGFVKSRTTSTTSSTLALTIPRNVVTKLGYRRGDRFLVTFKDGKIVYEKIGEEVEKRHGKVEM